MGTEAGLGLALLLALLSPGGGRAQTPPEGFLRFQAAYGSAKLSYSNGSVLLPNGRALPWLPREGRRGWDAVLENPSLADQVSQDYFAVPAGLPPPRDHDPGRARVASFFDALYGASAKEVESRLMPVIWLAATAPTRLLFNSSCGAAAALAEVSRELDARPSLRPYLEHPAGTYIRRPIEGTARPSPHSWGIAIDIDTRRSDYWLWQGGGEGRAPAFRNRIPLEIVAIFERQGFIWGGRWYHFDTMHFEYRPELLLHAGALTAPAAGVK
jgi:hypothetical protein